MIEINFWNFLHSATLWLRCRFIHPVNTVAFSLTRQLWHCSALISRCVTSHSSCRPTRCPLRRRTWRHRTIPTWLYLVAACLPLPSINTHYTPPSSCSPPRTREKGGSSSWCCLLVVAKQGTYRNTITAVQRPVCRKPWLPCHNPSRSASLLARKMATSP